VPTIAETSGMAEYDVSLWLGVLAPAGTPKDVIARLQGDIAAVMAMPEIIKQMADAGIEVRSSTPAEFTALIRSDLAKWPAVVKRSGMQIQ
jgi:tripartite-type tricarboxylate transporter receptor subunit TctC